MSTRTWAEILAEHEQVVAGLRGSAPLLDALAAALIDRLRAGGRVYLFGNGGSAADAQHIAGEFLGRFKLQRRSLPAVALSTDTSTLTAIANDYGFEQVFARQLEGLITARDAAWALSTSGNSPNVLAGLKTARSAGALTIGFSGESGGKMRPLCDHCLCVPHTASDRIQEGHLLAYHFICERVEDAFA